MHGGLEFETVQIWSHFLLWTVSNSFDEIFVCYPWNLNSNIFQDLLDYIGKHRPHVVILLGPFVDSKQPLIDECNTNGESYDEIFNRLLKMIDALLVDLPMTQVIIQHCTRDIHHRFIYPTPKMEIDNNRIISVPDPAMISIGTVSETYKIQCCLS